MNDRPVLAAAERAADWLIGLRAAERTDDLSLATGTAGVLAFFLHAARAYDEPRDLAQACAAGDVLAAAVRTAPAGDLGGIAWALYELAATAGEARYAAGVRAAVDRLATAGPSPDATAALALLHAGEGELAAGYARALAARRPTTLNAIYALAAIGAATGGEDLRAAAEHGLEDLRGHGPGSARLLAVLTTLGFPPWWKLIGWTAREAMAGGVPDRPFRDGGSAGLADWMLDLHHLAVAGHPVGDAGELLAWARTLTADLLDRAVVDAAGARWPAGGLPAATGWARGAAGIGSWLVRLDTYDQGRESVLRLPDNPW